VRRFCTCLSWIVVFFLVVFPLPAHSQACPSTGVGAAQASIASKKPLITLSGNVHPLALPQYDRGPSSGAMHTGRLMLILKRTSQQEQELQQLLSDVQNPRSSSFHKFVTPEQFGQRFGVDDAGLCRVGDGFRATGSP
jgi:trimeric autotransporter adhesin